MQLGNNTAPAGFEETAERSWEMLLHFLTRGKTPGLGILCEMVMLWSHSAFLHLE